MKQMNFYQWLEYSRRKSQEYPEDCDLCMSRGYEATIDDDVVACEWCGDEFKLEDLRKEYEAQRKR